MLTDFFKEIVYYLTVLADLGSKNKTNLIQNVVNLLFNAPKVLIGITFVIRIVLFWAYPL